MAEPVEAVSPLDHLDFALRPVEDASGGALRLCEVRFASHLNLRLDPTPGAAEDARLVLGKSLPVVPNTTARAAGVTVAWLGPDEWLVIGPPGTSGDLQARLRAGLATHGVSLVDVSAHRTTITVSGPAARSVLGGGCPIDLHPLVFPDGACCQTLLARAGVILVVDDPVEPCFQVLVRSSFADYVARWLLDAAEEHRVQT